MPKNLTKTSNWISVFFFFSVWFPFLNNEKKSLSKVKVETEFAVSGKQIRLKLIFSSETFESFLFDKNVFSIFNAKTEQKSHLEKNIDETSVYNAVKTTQCIVENKAGVRRFFSNIRLFENEVIQAKSVLQLDPSYDSIYVTPSKEVTVTTEFIDVNWFRNSRWDSVIRITYIYRPNDAQKEAGFKPIETTSNWFSIAR